MKVLITGAAGNLGSLFTRFLMADQRHELRLLVHKSSLPFDISGQAGVSLCRGDLSQAATLPSLCAGMDCVVHLAGMLFVSRPEEVLPKTNIGFVENLAHAARDAGVRKFVLVSFPHAEGETTPAHPAVGITDANPRVTHFRTRLEAERRLLEICTGTPMAAVVFRAGIVYGREIKLFKAAHWLLRRRLLAIWRKPTWAHLISLPDFLKALRITIDSEDTRGIYQVCDDGPLTLQDLLDKLADHYGCPRPLRLPAWLFHTAGRCCEMTALVLRTAAPLNRDIVRAGMTSCVADTSRMKRELLPALAYPTFKEGIDLL
jgi:nucleoside-diphosphate-sugar epimerase